MSSDPHINIIMLGENIGYEAAYFLEEKHSSLKSPTSGLISFCPKLTDDYDFILPEASFFMNHISREEKFLCYQYAYQTLLRIFKENDFDHDLFGKVFISQNIDAWARELYNFHVADLISQKKKGSWKEIFFFMKIKNVNNRVEPDLPSHWLMAPASPKSTSLISKETQEQFQRRNRTADDQEKKNRSFFHPLQSYKKTPFDNARPIILITLSLSQSFTVLSIRALAKSLIEQGFHIILLSRNSKLTEVFEILSKHITFLELPNVMPLESSADVTFLHRKTEHIRKMFISAVASGNDAPLSLFNKTALSAVEPRVRKAWSTLETGRIILESFDVCGMATVSRGIAGVEHIMRHAGLPTFDMKPIAMGKRYLNPEFSFDHYMVYGEQARDTLKDKGVPDSRIFVAGSPYFDQYKGRNKDADRHRIHTEFPESAGKKIVIVASENREQQNKEIEPSLQVLGEKDSVFTILKLHPNDSASRFSAILERHDNMALSESPDPAYLLNGSDCVVSMLSNIVIEAAVCGTPAISYNFTETELSPDYTEEGIALPARTVEAFSTTVDQVLFDSAFRNRALADMAGHLHRLAGPNTGKAADLAARYIADTLRS